MERGPGALAAWPPAVTWPAPGVRWEEDKEEARRNEDPGGVCCPCLLCPCCWLEDSWASTVPSLYVSVTTLHSSPPSPPPRMQGCVVPPSEGDVELGVPSPRLCSRARTLRQLLCPASWLRASATGVGCSQAAWLLPQSHLLPTPDLLLRWVLLWDIFPIGLSTLPLSRLG